MQVIGFDKRIVIQVEINLIIKFFQITLRNYELHVL